MMVADGTIIEEMESVSKSSVRAVTLRCERSEHRRVAAQ
jgi:hypothetical protein